MNLEKMSRWLLMAMAAVAIFVIGFAIGNYEGVEQSTPLAEMTVEQLFVLVIIAALIIGR